MMRKILILLLALSFSYTLNAQVHKFQAAYLYNICKYLEWPEASKKGDFVIAVLGSDPIIAELKKIAASKKYVNQTIKVLTFKSTSSITKCHVLYVPESQSSQIATANTKLSKFNTLLVTNYKKGISNGAGINFVLVSSKLKFEMKKTNITKKNIKVNSSIEKLAIKKY